MIVSFDLDDTLFINPEKVAAERAPGPLCRLIYKERLRAGTADLIKTIQKSGVKVWVYTSSFRSERYIRSFFRRYGVRLDGVVNGQRHKAEVQGTSATPLPSKYPSRYRIDLHVDDDVSVAQNGRVFGFKVYLITDGDRDWAERIEREIARIRRLKGANGRA